MESKEEKKILALIDANAVIHRSYHALPKSMSTSKGELTNAVYGFTTTLIRVLEDLHPTHIAVSFDLAGPTFRHLEYKEYKGTRVKADQELYDQIPKVRKLLEVFNIPVYEKEGFEADDCIGTVVEECKGGDVDTYIVTGDKDAFQLVNGNIFIYWLKRGIGETKITNRDTIYKEWQLEPEDFIDLKALAGDPSDNIPGVPGIGPKTAVTLLQKFDTLVDLFKLIEKELNPDGSIEAVAKKLEIRPRIVELLLKYKDQSFLSQRLATIRRDAPIDFKLEDCLFGDYDRMKAREFFEEMQFRSLLRRFGILPEDQSKTKKAEVQKEKDEQLKLL